MSPTATTVGGYLRDLPADRRVAMARVCSMIRRSARGVRESMRYGLAFYELQGPLFALESTEKRMILFIAEPSVLENYKSLLTGVLEDRSAIEFIDLNRIPLDSLEKIVRDSVAARRERLKTGKAPTQKELLVLWKINEEDAKAPPPVVRIPMKEEVTEETVVEAAPEEPERTRRNPSCTYFQGSGNDGQQQTESQKSCNRRKTCQTHSRQSSQGRFRRTEESDRCQENND